MLENERTKRVTCARIEREKVEPWDVRKVKKGKGICKREDAVSSRREAAVRFLFQ